MCGVFGVIGKTSANQTIYDALLLLQHRGQDAAGITTYENLKFHTYKAKGTVRDVFKASNMQTLTGNLGLGHVRYPTAGNNDSIEEAQPLYVNAPFGIVLVHNGNLINTSELKQNLVNIDFRHTNTESDSEVLLNVLAHELMKISRDSGLTVEKIFQSVNFVHKRLKGSYAVICLIAGYGLLAFRDIYGIRPLCFGKNDLGQIALASESVALEGIGFNFESDILPGEAIFIDEKTLKIHTKQCCKNPILRPCIFEYVYFARPDSTLDKVSVYQARIDMGEILAKRVISKIPPKKIDVIIPIPESGRPSAMQLAQCLGIPYREGFVKNRYLGRTFIMPGQTLRKKSVRQKLNTINSEFKGRNVLLVDDSIVRGTTSKEIIKMARDAGANKVYLASAAPPVCYPNIYGIDMPTKEELIAHNKNIEEIADFIGCDSLIYQDLNCMKQVIMRLNPNLKDLEASCFDGIYITKNTL